ncbi:MAG: hypothetical protein GY757_54445 [bacterium]|nr:hypothetical protein [bacterium]
MAKRIIWSKLAQRERREILEYWAERNGDKVFSKQKGIQFPYDGLFRDFFDDNTFTDVKILL